MLFADCAPEEDRKSLIQMLGKLYLPDEIDEDKIRILKLLVQNLQSVRAIYFVREFLH